MAEKTKNLCAQIPESLHNRVRQEQEASELTLSQYITKLITEYYEGGKAALENTRTMAVQIPEELFQQLKDYLLRNHLKQKEFIADLIRQALESEAE